MIADAALAALLGFGLGVVTGMPIGVVNMAIVDAASRGERRFAQGIGIGGALADAVHAGLAFVGVARLLEAKPALARGLAIAAAVLIIGYALFGARRAKAATVERRAHGGIATGVLLTLPNPAALTAWAAVAASVWPTISTINAVLLAIGLGLGSALWFTLLARWVATLPAESRIRRVLPTLALVLLVGVALVGLVRAFA